MKEFRIEDPRCRCSGRARQIESPTRPDWLAFRAPLVTLVTFRRQVSSIYRTCKQLIEVTIRNFVSHFIVIQAVNLGQKPDLGTPDDASGALNLK